jgi:hypothetical protein
VNIRRAAAVIQIAARRGVSVFSPGGLYSLISVSEVLLLLGASGGKMLCGFDREK